MIDNLKFIKILPNYWKIIYKLLNDLLFLLLAFFLLILIAEGVLPGLISDRISLYLIALAILTDITAISKIAKTNGIKVKNSLDKKTDYPLIFILALLLINSLLRLDILLATFIFVVVVIVGYYLYKIFEI